MDVIVVGVDGSHTAECAAKEAAALAAATGARLHVITAFQKSRDVKVKAAAEGLWTLTSLDQAERLVADLAQRVSPDGVTHTTAVVSGKPADAIVEEAQRVGASLIVVGNKHVQGASRLLGSIATDIAHHAPCSVYIAKTT